MNSEKPDDRQTGPIGPAGNWASTFLDYLALKLRLFVVESTEATGHCIRLLILLGIALGLTVGSILTYGAFILYLVMLLLRLDWGWSALICAITLCGQEIQPERKLDLGKTCARITNEIWSLARPITGSYIGREFHKRITRRKTNAAAEG
jgi:uncharacterized membrane protein YqjE